MSDSIRLRLATFFAWLSFVVTPRIIKPMARGYMQAISGAMAEIKDGRTYGVLYAAWSLGGSVERHAAADIEEATRETAHRTRRQIERMIKEGRYP